MFIRNKISTVVKLALASTMAVGLTGCLVEGDTSVSTNGGIYQTVSQPTGTVIGTVQDTNGNPLADVTVYLAGKSTTTDAGGIYRFDEVPATNTVGADDDIVGNPLSVTVAAPTGYLGATVTVAPQAQIDGSVGNNTLDNPSNPVTVFIEGYIAQAGVAVLPALTSSVTGVLRNSSTGEAISSTSVRLDLEEVMNIQQQQAQDGVSTTYQTLAYSATTDSSGNFTIANVPDDAELRFMVEGYSIASVGANGVDGDDVTTADETLVSVGNLNVSPITALDITNPFVNSVTGVVNQAAATGMFNDDIDGTAGIVINFSETLITTEVDSNSVVVWDDENGYQTAATATMATDGMSITVTTPAAITAGAEVEVYLLTADFLDLSDNVLTTGAGVGFDSAFTSATDSEYLMLDLQIFTESNTDATAVSLTQASTDASGIDDYADVQAKSVAFNDVDDEGGTGNFQQLNSADDDNTFGGSDAGERLSALATQLGAGTVAADVARISFTPTNATYYSLAFTDSDGTAFTPTSTVWSSNADTSFGGAGEFEVTDTADVTLVVTGVQPGDVLLITPYDDFEHAGTTTSITLIDNVEPTTVLQNSYGVSPQDDAVVTTYDFGDGGQLTSVGAQTIGTPYLNVTPQLLDNLDANGDDTSTLGAGNDDDVLLHELMELNTVDGTTSDQYITPAAAGPYDATAYAAIDPARSIGVAMSEDIAVTGTPAFSGTTAALSGWVAHNDVTVDDEGTAVNADLVDVDVDSVFSLAADNNADIDFSDTIEDTATAANTASSSANARVVIRDAMPPMVVSAVWDGYEMEITFNEAVAPEAGDTVTFGTVTFALDQDTVDAFDTSGTPTVLTIPADDANWAGLGSSSGLYGDLDIGTDTIAAWSYVETAYGVSAGHHGILDFSAIEDAANGNSWDNDSAGVTAPTFAFFSSVADTFSVSSATTDTDWANAAAAGSIITFTYTGNHAIDMTQFDDGTGGAMAANSTAMSAAQVAANFTLTSAATIDTGTVQTNASLSTDGTTLTVSITTAGAVLTTGDTFDLGGTAGTPSFLSDFDATQAEAAGGLTLTVP